MVPGTEVSMGRLILPQREQRHMVPPSVSEMVRARRVLGQKPPKERADQEDRNAEGGLVFGPPAKDNDVQDGSTEV